jgi:hypothetical protein
LYGYDAQEPDELTFAEDDVLVITKDGGDWWTGHIVGKPSKVARLPCNYVEMIVTGSSSTAAAPPQVTAAAPATATFKAVCLYDYESQTATDRAFAENELLSCCAEEGEWKADWFKCTSTLKSVPQNYVQRVLVDTTAAFDFQESPPVDGHLCFAEGDVVLITEKSEGGGDGWWTGLHVKSGTFGICPSNYLSA